MTELFEWPSTPGRPHAAPPPAARRPMRRWSWCPPRRDARRRGGHPAEQRLLVDLTDGEAVVGVFASGARSAQPRYSSTRRPCARMAAIAIGTISFGQQPRAGLQDVKVGQPLPQAQGGVGRQPPPVGVGVTAHVAHRGQADRRPTAYISVGPNNALAARALRSHIIRLSVSPVPIPRPTYSGGAWYGDGR